MRFALFLMGDYMGGNSDGANQLELVAGIMRRARRLLFITGAGVSADSGLPTYRGIGGLYEDTHTEDGLAIEDALSGQVMSQRPEITWKYLLQIEHSCRDKGPNKAHHVIAGMQDRWHVCVITQNIDGFHTAAGSRNVIEMHGNFQQLLCMQCGAQRQVENYAGLTVPPRCGSCGGIERPGVVLFGEMLPEAALGAYYNELSYGFDMVFSVGTTSVFPYIYGPVEEAITRGTPTVEINPGRTHLSGQVDFHLKERAAICLEQLQARF